MNTETRYRQNIVPTTKRGTKLASETKDLKTFKIKYVHPIKDMNERKFGQQTLSSSNKSSSTSDPSYNRGAGETRAVKREFSILVITQHLQIYRYKFKGLKCRMIKRLRYNTVKSQEYNIGKCFSSQKSKTENFKLKINQYN